jgi:hypothetical protein
MKPAKLLPTCLAGLILLLLLVGFGSSASNDKPVTLFVYRQTDTNEQTGSNAKPQDKTDVDDAEDSSDPDMPPGMHGSIDKETYLRMRDEYIALRRGVEPGRPIDPRARGRAIEQMEGQELELSGKNSFLGEMASLLGLDLNAGPTWTAIGPAPLPNSAGLIPGFSGRVTAVVVDPTNPNIVYLGAAQGGVWRSLDGGATWASIFDNAQSLAIGALALAPSDHTILYVGTGEFNGCGDCFFGAGLYRIDNADTAAILVGPINPSQTIGNLTYNIFSGRSISKVLVHPTDPNIIFVATGSGVGGSGANTFSTVPPMATRGVYRSTNAMSATASVTFQKLVVTTDGSIPGESPQTGNDTVSDMVMEPGNPNNIVVAVIGQNGLGGIYRSINALSGTPTFNQALSLANGVRVSLAINNVGGTVTAYAGTSETPTNTPVCTTANSGAVRKSTDGGANWTGQLTGGGGYCSGQCFYDMPIAVDPNDPNVVYVGGQSGSNPSLQCGGVVRKSTDGGSTFANDSNGLHADEHALFFDGAGNIYAGNDGGLWKRSASAVANTAWTNLNNAPLNTLQFESVAVHPLDQFLTIGGTQDNGTEAQQTSSGNWRIAEGGDGGYTLIDQGATNTTNVTMYLTFFNRSNSQIMFDRATLTSCLSAINSWPTRGTFACGNPLAPCPDNSTPASQCDSLPFFKNNGIQLTDNVLFYAPMALGPGTPNTIYFGTDRLYRSTDMGDNMTIVGGTSTSPLISTGQTRCLVGQTCPPSTPASVGTPVSTIAISPQDDNYRVVGMQTGRVFATSTGSPNLVEITSGSFPTNPSGSSNRFVGRAIIDPNNKDVAYIAFSFFAPAGQGVWKITNLGAAAGATPVAPNWTAAGNGIPSIPINAFAVDPLNSNNLFAGTDIGVYNSTDGGVTWNPFGTGLPRVAVFDMKIQSPNRILRVATHGRGIWEISIGAATPTIQLGASSYTVGEGAGSAQIVVTRSDSSGAAAVDYRTTDTDTFTVGCADKVNNLGSAYGRCDFATVVGTLSFAAGEASKTVFVPIIDDAYAEGNETFSIVLSNPTGATLGSPATATVTINDNETVDGTNPILLTNDMGIAFFVRQHYLDFLGREPELGEPWSAILRGCANQFNTDPNSPSAGCDRLFVSGSFFGSPEFKFKGGYTIGFYLASLNRRPQYSEFVVDLASVSGATAAEVFAKRAAFAEAFVQRPEFANQYGALSATDYVNALMGHYGLASITTPDPANPEGATKVTLTRNDLIAGLNNSSLTKAKVLRAIVQSDEASAIEALTVFVASQYYGYLRRTPEQSGFNDWVNYLTAHPNDFRTMVNGFLNSQEYRLRFGPP